MNQEKHSLQQTKPNTHKESEGINTGYQVFHSNEYQDSSLLECDVIQYGTGLPTFHPPS